MIHTFLPELYGIENRAAVEIFSNTSQPSTHNFLDCIIVLIVLASHLFFHSPTLMAVFGCKIQTALWVQEHFPAVLCSCFQCHTCNVRSWIAMLKDNSISHQAFVTKSTSYYFQHLNIASRIDDFSLA